MLHIVCCDQQDMTWCDYLPCSLLRLVLQQVQSHCLSYCLRLRHRWGPSQPEGVGEVELQCLVADSGTVGRKRARHLEGPVYHMLCGLENQEGLLT